MGADAPPGSGRFPPGLADAAADGNRPSKPRVKWLRTGVALALAASTLAILSAALPRDYGGPMAVGTRDYAAGRFQEAEKSLDAALKAKPGDARAQMARGCARYRLQRWQDAAADFDTVAQGHDARFQQSAEYNAGNCLFRQERYADAVTRYRRALILNPSDQDAKFNLELALKRLQESKSPPQAQQKRPHPSPKNAPRPAGEREQEQPPTGGKPGQGEGQPSQSPGANQLPEGNGQMSRAQAEQLLRALAADESNLRRLSPRPPMTGEPKPTDKTW
jgi:Ca-activated chloride channel family protein